MFLYFLSIYLHDGIVDMRKILSIDGGGIRGLIPALVLAEIEQKTGKAIAECFDLIAGTSTGGILALGFSKHNGNLKPQYTACELAEIYQNRGNEIFPHSLWETPLPLGGYTEELYSHTGLEKILDEYFGTDPLSTAITKTLITSYDIQSRESVFLKSWRPEYSSTTMKEAARATSAAPTYYEPAIVSIDGVTKVLVDGGVFINSPSVSAYAEAKKLFPEENDFFLLSLGTGELSRPIPYSDAKNWGKVGWLMPLLGCMFDGMADASDYQMKTFLGKNYIRLQTSLTDASDDLDNVTNSNIKSLIEEAKKLIKIHKSEIEEITQLLIK